ncbi:SMEK domain-containing protein [Dongia soli]|uniref:SMEK domain-containing protein n=1 Tax=Dongia soli TaxID=600628 RepID=A0ABU5EJM3_9PROT|nr:SMEK domain-containing protein [Dongia soli]MDY0885396.1 SMEK domain-containing protein [Dongia soli]
MGNAYARSFIGQIVDDLAGIAAQAKQRARLHLFDLHTHVENFAKEVLNRALDLGLSNLNNEHSNNPGLDLGDASKGWAFQVTADKSAAKVKGTLDKIDATQKSEYPNIRILVIGEKQGSYTFNGEPYDSLGFTSEMV